MIDFVKQMSTQYDAKVPRTLKTTLNRFFRQYPACAEGCVIQPGWMQGSQSPVVLIIESSTLYSYLSGEYGWSMHTAWHENFTGAGWYPEMINNCQISFWKE